MSEQASTEVLTPVLFRDLDPTEQRQRLQEIAVVFLRLGAIAFGGPAAHIAMMEDEVVQRRQWLDRQRLLDLMGVTNLIPGPNSTELAIHLGLERGGWRGLVLAGTCFILPAMAIVWLCAILYVQYRTLPEVESIFYGVKPAIAAIVAMALWKLGHTAIKSWPTAIAAGVTVAAFAVGANEIVLLFLAGAGGMAWYWARSRCLPPSASSLAIGALPGEIIGRGVATATVGGTVGWLSVFLAFLKIGSVLYGGGYVMLAFLRQDFVERAGWLTNQQLLDAVAVGQFTPGPVFTTATFVGYLLAGHAGAVAATVGIFLPAFVLVAAVSPLAPRLRRSPLTSAFLDGVNAASLGLMAVVTLQLGRAALIDPVTVAIAAVSVALLIRVRVNSAWLVLGGGLMGWVAQWLPRG